jgi:hypothetical protein
MKKVIIIVAGILLVILIAIGIGIVDDHRTKTRDKAARERAAKEKAAAARKTVVTKKIPKNRSPKLDYTTKKLPVLVPYADRDVFKVLHAWAGDAKSRPFTRAGYQSSVLLLWTKNLEDKEQKFVVYIRPGINPAALGETLVKGAYFHVTRGDDRVYEIYPGINFSPMQRDLVETWRIGKKGEEEDFIFLPASRLRVLYTRPLRPTPTPSPLPVIKVVENIKVLPLDLPMNIKRADEILPGFADGSIDWGRCFVIFHAKTASGKVYPIVVEYEPIEGIGDKNVAEFHNMALAFEPGEPMRILPGFDRKRSLYPGVNYLKRYRDGMVSVRKIAGHDFIYVPLSRCGV